MTQDAQDFLFHGHTYDPDFDYARLARQIDRIKRVMGDAVWRTVSEIHAILRTDPENSIQAQLRNLRKSENGALNVERRTRGDREKGLYEYRIAPKPDADEEEEELRVTMTFSFDLDQRRALARYYEYDGDAPAGKEALKAWVRSTVDAAMQELVEEQ